MTPFTSARVRRSAIALAAASALCLVGMVPAQAYTRNAQVELVSVSCDAGTSTLTFSWSTAAGKPTEGYVFKDGVEGQPFRVSRKESVAGVKSFTGTDCPSGLWGIYLRNRQSITFLDTNGNTVPTVP